jgi:hypothetical protein
MQKDFSPPLKGNKIESEGLAVWLAVYMGNTCFIFSKPKGGDVQQAYQRRKRVGT